LTRLAAAQPALRALQGASRRRRRAGKERAIPSQSSGRPHTATDRHSEAAAIVLAAVAEPNRVRLLRLLLDGERCVAQCTDQTGLVQSLVSKHLARLVDAGLVRRRRSGRRSYHSVVDAEGLQELLTTAERLAEPRNAT
jgi:DNA-binding transcriptional ArsR family regulator